MGLDVRRDDACWSCHSPVHGTLFASELEDLVEAHYRKQGALVRREQGYRDFLTGRIIPLQIDHIHARSHGRDDRRENLRAVSAWAHDLIHRKNQILEPHPYVLRAMRWHGWGWDEEKQLWVRE